MKLIFLHTSDTHGFLLPTDYQKAFEYEEPFGLSRVKTVIDQQIAKYGRENMIITDAGDCLQGSPLATFCNKLPFDEGLKYFTEAYNQIGYDARCLGNHDFNYGLDYLKYYIEHNKSPFINDNIYTTNHDLPFGQDEIVIEKNGIKVGILGFTTQYIPHWERQENIEGLEFTSVFDELKNRAKKLKEQVDVLAMIYHGGFEADPESGEPTEPDRGENEAFKALQQIPEIDLFLTGHQHRRLAMIVNGKALVQPGYRGEAVAKVELEIDDANKSIKDVKVDLLDTKDSEADPKMVELLHPLEAKTQEWLDQPLAHMDKPARIEDAMEGRLHGAPFINLLQSMQLWFTKADVSATAVMSDVAKGFGKVVTMRDVILNYPYANQLVRVKLTGKQLTTIIEHSLTFLEKTPDGQLKFLDRWIKPKRQLYHFDVFYPVKYTADISKPPMHRLTSLTLNGKPLEDDKIYYLAVNNYRANGGGFYPEYSLDKIDLVLDYDYVEMFRQYLTSDHVQFDEKPNYRFD
ncbi:MAG: bifunctional UDP-sugar hydrolase/5'-nucleotidase [Lactobacillus sp.]|nr:bifunctional UDP-sugar hydrolase/5'-nucleotidase [Lactobacillus sp.]